LYTALADFKHHWLSLAAYQLAYTCPAEFVKHGCCSWLSAAEVQAASKSTDDAVVERLRSCEEVLHKARKHLEETGIKGSIAENAALAEVFILLDVQMARLAFGKQKGFKVVFETPAEVARAFLQEFAKRFPLAELQVYERLWPTASCPAPAPAAPEVTNAAALPLYNRDDSGEIDDPLAKIRESGYDVGDFVRHLPSGQICKISEARPHAGAEIRLTKASDGAPAFELALAAFLAGCTPASAKDLEEKHEGWPQHRAGTADASKNLATRGAVFAALHSAVGSLQSKFAAQDCLELWSKPVRTVKVTAPVAKGGLVLLPETSAMKCVGIQDAVPELAAEVFVHPGRAERVFLLPALSSTSVAPYWAVRSTDDPAKANVVVSEASVQVLMGLDFTGPTQPFPSEAEAVPAPKGAAKRKKKDEQKDAAQGTEVAKCTEVVVRFPCLVSSVSLNAGDELLVLASGPKEKPKKAPTTQMLTLSAVQARAKKLRKE
jgi:hypothetical protein